MAAVYLACNRGKRSVVLDLQTDDGRARLADLVAASDVLVHNMRRDAAVRCGADPDTLLAVNPDLVHCAIVGFGAEGPYADLPAYDDTVQAVAGIAGAAGDLCLQPSPGPALLAPAEEGDDELVLGDEVAVQRHLRHAGLGDDPVDPDRPRSVAAEQVVGRVEDALAGGEHPGEDSAGYWRGFSPDRTR
jgi:hypothetical protein